VHPRGLGYSGTLRIDASQAGRISATPFERPGEHPVLFRFSRGLGLPEALPDVLGLSVRLQDAHGAGRHQDFLLVSSALPPLLRHVLIPSLGFFAQPYSSVLAYRVGDGVRLVGARPASRPAVRARGALPGLAEAAGRGEARFRLTVASLGGSWLDAGELAIGDPLPDAETERLAFTPWNTGGGITPTGPFMGLRRAAYRGSQSGRGLPT
jgi:hypothetical protein